MARRLAAGAEIVRRADEALAEVMHPDAVHDHAGGERIALGGDRLRQLEPAAAFLEGLGLAIREHLEEVARNDIAVDFRLAAHEDVRVMRVRANRRRPSLSRRRPHSSGSAR